MTKSQKIKLGVFTCLFSLLIGWLISIYKTVSNPIAVALIFTMLLLVMINSFAIEEKKTKKWIWFSIVLLFFIMLHYSGGPKNDPENQGVIVETPPPQKTAKKPVQKKTVVKKQKAAWKEKVKIDGSEIDRKVIRVPKQGYYDITYLDGKIYDTLEKKMRGIYYGIHGANYDPTWLRYFPYSHVLGVKALEILFIVDSEVESESAKVYQFPDHQETIRIWINEYVRFFRHEAFRRDRYGNLYCFLNNSGYWLFEIKEAKN